VAEKAGIVGEEQEFAVLAVLSAPRGQPATVNLLAPLVINSVTRAGAQVFLEGSRFTTRELFVTPQPSQPPAPPAAETRSEPEKVSLAG